MEKEQIKETKEIIRGENLSIGYGRRVVASGLDFSVPRGSVTALLGRNGAGKSTLLKTITGELRPLSGEVLIDGRPTSSYSHRQLALKLAIVTTDSVQAGGLTVDELVALGRHPHTGISGRLLKADRRAVDAAMDATGIAFKRNSYVAELSDGERQKAMIARALAQETPLIVLDEPFSFIDAASRISLMLLLRRLATERSLSVLFSSHDIGQALRLSDYALLFDNDSTLHAGPPHQLVENNTVGRLFNNAEVRFDPSLMDFVAKQQSDSFKP